MMLAKNASISKMAQDFTAGGPGFIAEQG